jgi:taurine dioxygenase
MPIRFDPLHPALGAEVHGVSVHEPGDSAQRELLRSALGRYRLLLLRNQPNLDVSAQVAFTEMFGELYVWRSYKGEMGGQGYYPR